MKYNKNLKKSQKSLESTPQSRETILLISSKIVVSMIQSVIQSTETGQVRTNLDSGAGWPGKATTQRRRGRRGEG
jgi:hypothetical protein